MEQVVTYIRVSTARQGQSGLGLDAQRTAVAAYCLEHSCTVLREFREVESGKNNHRKVLQEALRFAKRNKARLVIAKLDRLARNVAFIAKLLESDVDFAFCDLPSANKFLLHIMASVAEHEGKAISDRTIAALQAAKARGTALGGTNPNSRNLTDAHRRKGAEASKAKASEYYAPLAGELLKLHGRGLSLRQIAEKLNDDGRTTRRGGSWNAMQVSRALERVK